MPGTDNVLSLLLRSEAAMTQCEFFSGNDVISCFPNATDPVTIPQHQWASFVCASPPSSAKARALSPAPGTELFLQGTAPCLNLRRQIGLTSIF